MLIFLTLTTLLLLIDNADAQLKGQPPNSFVSGSNWYCKDGYEKKGNSCVNIFDEKTQLSQQAQMIPDLSDLDMEVQRSIKLACIRQKSRGPASYSSCLHEQLGSYSNVPKIPNLSDLDREVQRSIKLACIRQKSRGPASYSSCLHEQLENYGVSVSVQPSPPYIKPPKKQELIKPKTRPNITYSKEADRLARERKLLEEERKKLERLRLAEKNRQQQPPEEQTPRPGTGSGFFVSKMGHVITNAHVVKSCNKVAVGDNANTQVPAKVISADMRNDLALLKITSLEMASAESKSLIQKLSIGIIPLSSKGLLREEDVRLGEKVLVAGYPYGDVFSNTIKVTSGIVSATRGAGDDSGQFQLDAAVQPGNSGGPIYDSGGNIIGVVISQLDKLKVAKAIGSLPENVNFGIKASTVRQFLMSNGLPSKKANQAEKKSTEQLAEIAQNQTLMVICVQ